jgi:hypothetical protein
MVENSDVLVVAVPQSTMFRSLAERWRELPLIKRADIYFALVGRDGTVDGLPDFLSSAIDSTG